MTSIAGWNPDLSATVEALARAAARRDDDDAIRRAAQETGGLPVYCDMGGCLILATDGRVLQFTPEDGATKPVTDRVWMRVALTAAADRYSALSSLRPLGVQCPICHGSGTLEGTAARCANCGGSGTVDA
jgi:hypothetical protein